MRLSPESGFSLVEMAVVLVIVGVVASYALNGTAAYMATAQQNTSRQQLVLASNALTQFVSRNKRLPCPADGSLADSNALAGVESLAAAPDTTMCNNAIGVRVLPWRTLGVDKSVALDGWGHRITYQTMDGAGGLTRAGGMDMSGTRAAAADTTAPSVWLQNKGLTVVDAANNEILSPSDPARGGGAAFVLIAHGRDGAGTFAANGSQFPDPPAIETSRAADSIATTVFIAAAVNDAQPGAANFFDFILETPNVHTIATAAGLGPQ